MSCIVVTGPSFIQAKQQIQEGNRLGVELEYRLDMFDTTAMRRINELRAEATLPVLITLRSKQQGGYFLGSENERLAALSSLASLKPEYIDLEHTVGEEFLKRIRNAHPACNLILSYHNFQESPQDLEALYKGIRRAGVFHYKIATKANHVLDSLRMLRFLDGREKGDERVSGLCMGKEGEITRILGRIYGSARTYAPVDDAHSSAPGQIDAASLNRLYRIDELGPDTRVYGLIGDPVVQSRGHHLHNQAIGDFGIDGVYIKMRVAKEELGLFLTYAQELRFSGLSVTMPLKEVVLPYVQRFYPGSEATGAINTLKFTSEGIVGHNTDCAGALDAIEKKKLVRGTKLVVIGAGGAARAVAVEAKKRGAEVWILNRTPEKARDVADKLGCYWGGFNDFSRVAERGYDIIVNATSAGFDATGATLPFLKELLPGTIAMDVVYHPRETPFLLAAKYKRCRMIYGEEMFNIQAIKQWEFWRDGTPFS